MSLYEKIVSKQEKLALVGLGYVGMPIAVAFAKKVDVIGFDLNSEKINLYKQGVDPTKEVGDEAIKATAVDFTDDEKRLQEAKFIIVAVPTPVNTDHTPGYGSAAKYIGAIMKEITRDSLVYGTRNVTIVEVMGRNAGWLTGAAALAKAEDCEGVDMICLPEVAFDIDHFIERLDVLQRAKAGVVIAVSEGVRVHDGRYVCELTEELGPVDAFGHKTLTGAARFLANKAVRELGCKARAIELSTLQRCSSHMASRVDITEAFQVGGAAAKAAFEGHSGEMVGLRRLSNDPYQCTTELHDIHTIANFEKKVPGEWITPDGVGVTQEFLAYMRPLIQAELTPIYVDGLPRHIYIK